MRVAFRTLPGMMTSTVGDFVPVEGEFGVEQDFCPFSLPRPYPSVKYHPIRAHGDTTIEGTSTSAISSLGQST